MLSPNARILVTVRRGGGSATVAVNEQLAVRRAASVAVHVTGVEPTGKLEPLAGPQETMTGAAPPVAVAEPYVTTADWPLLEVTGDGATGHAIVGAGTIGEGRVGVLLHLAVRQAQPATAMVTRRIRLGRPEDTAWRD